MRRLLSGLLAVCPFSIGRIYRIPKISILQYLGLNEEFNA